MHGADGNQLGKMLNNLGKKHEKLVVKHGRYAFKEISKRGSKKNVPKFNDRNGIHLLMLMYLKQAFF